MQNLQDSDQQLRLPEMRGSTPSLGDPSPPTLYEPLVFPEDRASRAGGA